MEDDREGHDDDGGVFIGAVLLWAFIQYGLPVPEGEAAGARRIGLLVPGAVFVTGGLLSLAASALMLRPVMRWQMRGGPPSRQEQMAALHPERVIETDWGVQTTGVFACDIIVDAHDRQGLLRDISEIFTRERLNVVGVNTQSKQGKAHMSFTVEITNLQQLQRTLTLIHDVEGVVGVRRA